MKFKFTYLYITSQILLLFLFIFVTNSIAKEFIGQVISVNKKQHKIKIKIYNSSDTVFSWRSLFLFKRNNQVKRIIIIKLNMTENINNIKQGNLVKLVGDFTSKRQFILKQIQLLSKDPTGVRKRLCIIKKRRRNYINRIKTYNRNHMHNKRLRTSPIRRTHYRTHHERTSPIRRTHHNKRK